jgi:hypothetical protein
MLCLENLQEELSTPRHRFTDRLYTGKPLAVSNNLEVADTRIHPLHIMATSNHVNLFKKYPARRHSDKSKQASSYALERSTLDGEQKYLKISKTAHVHFPGILIILSIFRFSLGASCHLFK